MEKQEKKDIKINAQEQMDNKNSEERAFFLFYSLLLYGPGFIEPESKGLNGKVLANG